MLTVIAGYTLLLGLNGALSDLQRRQQHRDLIQALVEQVSAGQPVPEAWKGIGLEVSLLAQGADKPPRIQPAASGEQWLVSRRAVQLPSGEQRWLELRQNVTASLEQERTTQLLLVAAAGVSILFTSLLLRPVLRRGLVVPLDQLDQQLQRLEADNLGEHLLDPAAQPEELRSMAIAFNNLQQRLAAAWKRERAFVDGVAHELRTPITVISGHAQRLQRQSLPESAQRSADRVSAEALRMTRLLRVLRDLALIDAGRVQLHASALDPEAQLLQIYETLSTSAAGRLQLPQPAESPLPALWADADRLQQCLQELVGNALAYASGSIQLQAQHDGDQLVLQVLDQGPGIRETERALVLQRFRRGSTAAGTRGTGIGLALVDAWMRAMDGEVVIAEAPGGGADLQLRFSWAPPEP
ncbi:two-component sensor histidine kinase domain protein [Synechococcus sp. NOUM97013]|nr:two-component sensor histidine kinase domain protein [Synechococcus sp. NOUM97013]